MSQHHEALRLQTPLGRVRGLGSAKGGTHHWWLQRVTSMALLPLTIWFTFGVAGLAVWDAREQHKKGAYIPYVVERDAAGRKVGSGVLDGPRTLTDAQISKRLLAWLRGSRMVVADYAGLRELVSEAYDMTATGSIARGTTPRSSIDGCRVKPAAR